ncbi:uncharacterized protein LOC132798567 [Drosophila nasuta]|uniref:uncharacterized protein LOC132798567 n=1 Tax=Drosophila nasuta TaxID=42062 RepID=UPI00295E82A3|nr:uncharacterized protein LOC132798567 [Drosophila nasuta]
MLWHFRNLIALIWVLLYGKSLSITQTYTLIVEKLSFNLTEGQRTLDDGSNLFLMGRDRLVNGTVEILEDLGPDHFSMHIALLSDSSGNGEFKPLPYNISTTDPCTAIVDYGSMAKPSLDPDKNTNFPINGDVCPIPKGVYYFNDIKVSTDNLPSHVPRGFVKGVLTLFKDNATIGTFEMVARVEDKYM